MASIPVPCGCLSVLFLNFIVHVFSDLVITKNTPELIDFDFFIREDWVGLPASDEPPLKLPVPYVIIHHTPKTRACYNLRQCGNAMRSIQKQHIRLKLGDIAYNFCIGSEGGVFEGRGWDFKGAHTGRADNYSIGICMIGDWRYTAPPKIQMDALKSLLRTGVLMGKIRRDYKLIGHMQTGKTDCPGRALMEKISTWEHFAPKRHDFMQPTISRKYPIDIIFPPYQEYFRVDNAYPSQFNSPMIRGPTSIINMFLKGNITNNYTGRLTDWNFQQHY